MPEIVTAPELARRYHVTPRTICRWARAGILSAMRGSKRPLLFDLTKPLLIANHTYQVKLVADGAKIQYWSDGSLLFDYTDPKPYLSGWFGFRTTASHFHFAAFSVHRLP